MFHLVYEDIGFMYPSKSPSFTNEPINITLSPSLTVTVFLDVI